MKICLFYIEKKNIYDQLKNDEIILNDLRPKRDFLYVKDLVGLIEKILVKNFVLLGGCGNKRETPMECSVRLF